MATGIYSLPSENNQQYSLDVQLAEGATSSLTLNQNVASIVSATANRPGLIVVDRVDSGGNKTASKREYISFTGVSGQQLTGLVRALGGSTDQVHSVGAIVEFVFDVVQLEAIYDAILREHTFEGLHASLPSIHHAFIHTHFSVSGASLTGFEGRRFVNPSLPSLAIVEPNTLLGASGASVRGVDAIRPVWFIPGTVSAASTSIGPPVAMPGSGTIEFVTVTLQSPISAASLIVDINKNFSSIFDAATRPTIPGGGTFVSTASIASKIFARGNIFTVDLDAGGWFVDATVQFHAR